MSRSSISLLLTLSIATPLTAQGPATVPSLHSDLAALAADSMGGRLAGTPGARAAAGHLARRLAALGLAPAGDSGTYLQRVPLERRQFDPASTVALTRGARSTALRFGSEFVVQWGAPDSVATYQAVWGDLYTAAGVDSTFASAEGKFIVVIVPERKGLLVQGISAAHRPAGIIALFASSRYRPRALRAVRPGPLQFTGAADRGDLPPILYADLDSVTTALGPLTQGAAGAAAPFTVTPRLTRRTTPVTTWNVLALRPGADSSLAGEEVLFLSDYDHVGRTGEPGAGCLPIGADSVCNGAGAAAGAIAQLAVADQVAATPLRRSVLLAWVSADIPDHLGSRWLLAHRPGRGPVIAAIDLEPVARAPGDSLGVGGIREISPDLVRLADSVNADSEHPFILDEHFAALTDPGKRYCRSRFAELGVAGIPTLVLAGRAYPKFWWADDDTTQVNSGLVLQAGELAYRIGAALADRPSRLAVDTAVTRTLCR